MTDFIVPQINYMFYNLPLPRLLFPDMENHKVGKFKGRLVKIEYFFVFRLFGISLHYKMPQIKFSKLNYPRWMNDIIKINIRIFTYTDRDQDLSHFEAWRWVASIYAVAERIWSLRWESGCEKQSESCVFQYNPSECRTWYSSFCVGRGLEGYCLR